MEEQIQINEKTDSEWEVAGSGTAEPAENGDSPNVLKEWQLSLARKQDELNLLEIQLLKQQAELEAQKRNARNSLQLELDRMRMEAEERISREQNAFEAKRREQVEDLEKELWEKRETAGKEEERERFAALKKLEEEKEVQRARLEEERTAQERQLEEERNTQKKRLEEELAAHRKHMEEEKAVQERHLEEMRTAQKKYLEEEQKAWKQQQEAERSLALQALEEEIALRTEALREGEKRLKGQQEKVEATLKMISDKESNLEKREEDLKTEKINLERNHRRLAGERQRIEDARDNLKREVEEEFSDTIGRHQEEVETKKREMEELRAQLKALTREQETVKSFQEVYGEDPSVLRQTLITQSSTIDHLRDRLANCSDRAETERLSAENRQLQEKADRLEEENRNLTEEQKNSAGIENKYLALEAQYRGLQATNETLNNLLEEKQQELVRLSTPKMRLIDRDERIASLRKGYLEDAKALKGAELPNDSDEIRWLEGIRKKCSDYGISFPGRILYAFHTALKINEWSTITVLAGVSGTGKSELPRLYAAFGGLNFINVAVQPNWDSQESMLGFFNSIDNRFEPEPLLRFLVQCTEDEKYREFMSIVLLDEMNLAYVELYFAEFLSKLETRRGQNKNEVPKVEVKLGAGVEPYELPLTRTVLWTGTMNQDETTKSLSDKVLDRGLVIHFPRPKTLQSRKNMNIITNYIGDRPMLKKTTWAAWTTHEINFSGEQMDELNRYKKIVEDINDCLEGVGRALGHRVWQSIEYYIANYPTVCRAKREAGEEATGELKAAMKVAFEDQIVQKIMPKLRGIETRGRGRQSLQEIEDLLEKEGFENLKDDFEIACEQGYGQFIWSSAKYLSEDESSEYESD